MTGLLVLLTACSAGNGSASPTTERLPDPPFDAVTTTSAPLEPLSCFYGGALRRASGELGGQHDLGSGHGPGEGSQNLYGVAAGDYFVHMTTGPAPGCPWTLTLEQRPAP